MYMYTYIIYIYFILLEHLEINLMCYANYANEKPSHLKIWYQRVLEVVFSKLLLQHQ